MTSPLRLLMVEDSEGDAMLLAHALRKGGKAVQYERVEDASSMRAALERGGWDVVISDWAMPKFSALRALDVVREMKLDLPFIVLSGTMGEGAAVEAMRAGAHDFLVKEELARLGPAVERELRASKDRAAHRQGEAVAREREATFRSIIEQSGGTSLAGRLQRTFVLIGGGVSIAFVATILLLTVSWAWLIPEVEQCRESKAAASDLNAALLDEETNLRGYILTRDVKFLDSFHRGEVAFERANEALDANAAPVPALAVALARTRASAERWHERWAKPVLKAPADGAAASLQEGKDLFDAYRGEQLAFASEIAHRAETLSRREQRTGGLRVALELTIFLSLLVVVYRAHHALRAAIVLPVAALLRDIGRVRDGDLETVVHESGPSELRQIGVGLNDMVRTLAAARATAESRDERAREHSSRLLQILDASREFSESLNLSYVVQCVRSNTMAVGGYDDVIVWLMDDDQKGLRIAGSAESATHSEHGDTVAWRAAKSGRIAFEGPDGRIRFGDARAGPVRARAIPLIVGARVVGTLEARHADAKVVSSEALEVLEMLAAHAATAIESARLNEVAEERSRVDPLTRLHNRRRLEEDLEGECKRCARYARPLAFVMLDVDHFKAFNDTHGHPQADVALQEIAKVIEGAVRATDSAYRYGGEEFCILLRETSAENAMHFAERVRQRVELRFADGTMPGITASFGVAEFAGQMGTPRSLIEAADAAMYESKRGGRNRVTLTPPPPSPGPASSGTIAIVASTMQSLESGVSEG